jgi:hypothetical protein
MGGEHDGIHRAVGGEGAKHGGKNAANGVRHRI